MKVSFDFFRQQPEERLYFLCNHSFPKLNVRSKPDTIFDWVTKKKQQQGFLFIFLKRRDLCGGRTQK